MAEKKSYYEGMPTGLEALAIQRGIDDCMREVVHDARLRNPHERGDFVEPPKKGSGGWIEPRKFQPPPAEKLVGQIIDHFLGPATGKPAKSEE